MNKLTDIDKLEFSHGFDAGNYAAAYETENYDTTIQAINATSGHYSIGHLLGFFSSYELHEIPEHWCDEVDRYRKLYLSNR